MRPHRQQKAWLAPYGMVSKTRRRLFVREWRKHRGLTQEALAARAGVTQGLISHLENGRTDFTGNLLARLAEALQCNPADLLIRTPSDPDPIRLMKALKDAG